MVFLEADDRPVEAKVTYQYAKPGKFRFPVIEDQMSEAKKKTGTR